MLQRNALNTTAKISVKNELGKVHRHKKLKVDNSANTDTLHVSSSLEHNLRGHV